MMRASIILRAAHQRVPMIKFVGKRSPPKSIDHTPHAHPAAPSTTLPDSFANYRNKAQSHGPLGGQASAPSASSSGSYGAIGGHSGASLGSIKPKEGEFFDRSELPARFGRTPWSDEEIDAVTTGGASLFG